MRGWMKLWPLLLGCTLLLLNVEFVMMNILTAGFKIYGWNLFLISALLGNAEAIAWIWLIGKIWILMKENLGFKNFYSDIRATGIDKVLRAVVKIFVNRLDPDNENNKIVIERFKPNYFDMFLLGLCVGTWIIGLIIFRVTKWRGGLMMLFAGNTAKLGLFTIGYTFLGSFIFVFLIILLGYKIQKAIRFPS